jgi:nicotinamide mononucleotide transporter
LIKWATADASYKLSFAGFPYSIAALTISTTIGLALGWLLHHYTDASWPFLDAIACLLSIAGQWLMMKRKVEAWWIWILVECLYMYIYASKQLWPTAALYLFLCILAVKGAVNWARLARTHQYN